MRKDLSESPRAGCSGTAGSGPPIERSSTAPQLSPSGESLPGFVRLNKCPRSATLSRSDACASSLLPRGNALGLSIENFLSYSTGKRLACCTQYQTRSTLANLHQIRHRAFCIMLNRFAQQPAEALLHHVVIIVKQSIGKLHDLTEEHFCACAAHQRHARRAPVPAVA